MPKINLLDKAVAELIAAGEVVERPASVIKELVENSIDAGADIITVEIQRGGITYIRVTDNGCGISFEDVPIAFLRHATSKIKTDTDLDSIATLGFRGEALAAVSSVARVEMLTATANSAVGTHYRIEGGQECGYEEAGCPKGTTITIKDLFYNTPARMKFLKKDVSEANACAAVIDRIALSHPEVSFKFIRDGKLTLTTSGNGDIKGTVYSVLGREFSATLIDVDSEIEGIAVTGLTCKPIACRPTRNNQLTFLNGRLVRSGTVVAAAEQAYKNSAMIGKFPGFVLYLTVPYDTVDVNVHPAKTEVRFSDEKRVFNAVYGAVKAAITAKDTRPEVKLSKPTFSPFQHVTVDEYRQQRIDGEETVAERIYKTSSPPQRNDSVLGFRQDGDISFRDKFSYTAVHTDDKSEIRQEEKTFSPREHPPKSDITNVSAADESPVSVTKQVSAKVDVIIEKEPEEAPVIKVIGEAFSTYIVAEMGDSIFMIDKHAAHERILFNKLSKERRVEMQTLLTPISVTLAKEEYDVLTQNTELLLANGFEIEDFGNSAVAVRAIPSFLTGENLASLLSEIASSLLNTRTVRTEREEHILHSIACRAAIKAGQNTSLLEMQRLAEKVLTSQEIMYCPHGRPVAFEIKKRELEKQFGRIQ
ncbi:MAG: DNA mismatch repair endonuclease MutL [Clostridia bacterium]|nr:DNA mismatch repair endonuclease MutL [Clostridia bacterium]